MASIINQYGRPSQFGEAPRMSICCKSTAVRGPIGSKIVLHTPSAFALLAGAPILMPKSTITLLATAITNPWVVDAIQNYARDLDPGIGQCFLT
jgi:hypothetical protein